MLKKLIFGTGILLLAAFPLAAQKASQAEKDHPLEAPTPENPAYRKSHDGRDYTGISKDPFHPHISASTTNHSPTSRPPVADTAAVPPAEKKKPQR